MWPLPEAFVLTEVNAASDKWHSSSVCGWFTTGQGRDSGSAATDSVVSAFLLKLDPEARNGTAVPRGN